MVRDENWYDEVGKDEEHVERVSFSLRHQEYVGKWVREDFEGNALEVKDFPFPHANHVGVVHKTIHRSDPEWNNPPF